jgi:hypothetical protein
MVTCQSSWFRGLLVPLTAFAKNGGGVRPLAVGETLRRLTSKLGVSIFKDGAAMYFGAQDDPYAPLQLGVGYAVVQKLRCTWSVRSLSLTVVTLRLR